MYNVKLVSFALANIAFITSIVIAQSQEAYVFSGVKQNVGWAQTVILKSVDGQVYLLVAKTGDPINESLFLWSKEWKDPVVLNLKFKKYGGRRFNGRICLYDLHYFAVETESLTPNETVILEKFCLKENDVIALHGDRQITIAEWSSAPHAVPNLVECYLASGPIYSDNLSRLEEINMMSEIVDIFPYRYLYPGIENSSTLSVVYDKPEADRTMKWVGLTLYPMDFSLGTRMIAASDVFEYLRTRSSQPFKSDTYIDAEAPAVFVVNNFKSETLEVEHYEKSPEEASNFISVRESKNIGHCVVPLRLADQSLHICMRKETFIMLGPESNFCKMSGGRLVQIRAEAIFAPESFRVLQKTLDDLVFVPVMETANTFFEPAIDLSYFRKCAEGTPIKIAGLLNQLTGERIESGILRNKLLDRKNLGQLSLSHYITTAATPSVCFADNTVPVGLVANRGNTSIFYDNKLLFEILSNTP